MAQKPGPKPDPNRAEQPTYVRPHVRVDRYIRRRAEELGVPRGTLVSALLAHAVGMPECAPSMTTEAPDDSQGVLPLTTKIDL